MLKIGVIGAGHLGKIHIQQWKEVPTVQLIGFFDPSDEQAEKAIAEYNPSTRSLRLGFRPHR